MWPASVFCSGCSEESEVVVGGFDDVEHEVCACGSFVVLPVASFEPVYVEDG